MRWRRDAWLLVLGLGVVLFVIVERALIATKNPNFVPSMILVGATTVPVAFVTLVWGRRLRFDVPTSVVTGTALLTGIIGTTIAGVLEYDTLHALGVLPMLAIGLIEESAKFLVPLVVLIFLPYRRVSDGLLVGVASGAGFAALETMGYAFVTLIQSSGDIASTEHLLLLRGLLSPAGHMAWTGILAAVVWRAAAEGWSGRSVGRVVVAALGVVVLHAVWDGFGNLIVYVALATVSLGVLGWYTHTAARQTADPLGPEAVATNS